MRGTETEKRSYDALVVGAGVIGLACAADAARRGLRVAVLERDRPAAGATGVAAGMLAPVGEASWGEEPLLELNLASARRWPAFAAELEAESRAQIGFEVQGALHVALDRDEVEELRRRHSLHQRLGLDTSWLRPSECRRLERGLSTACAGGIHARQEASVDPQALATALQRALAARGGEIHQGAEVTDAETEGGALRALVTSDGRRFEAPAVVLAAGCWSGEARWLPEAAVPATRPVKGEVLTLRGSAAAPVCERILVGERVYMVPRADGRLVVGATVEERGFDATVTAGGVHELLREAYRTLPEVAELELAQAAAGLRPGTPDNAPLIGPGAIDGLLVATGHYRNGVLLAPITAQCVGALLAGERLPAEIDPFDPGRFAAARAAAEAFSR